MKMLHTISVAYVLCQRPWKVYKKNVLSMYVRDFLINHKTVFLKTGLWKRYRVHWHRLIVAFSLEKSIFKCVSSLLCHLAVTSTVTVLSATSFPHSLFCVLDYGCTEEHYRGEKRTNTANTACHHFCEMFYVKPMIGLHSWHATSVS